MLENGDVSLFFQHTTSERGASHLNASISFEELRTIDVKNLIAHLYSKDVLKPGPDYTVEIHPDLKNLVISFRNIQTYRDTPAPKFSLSALAMIALLIRRVSESGCYVSVLLPRTYRGRRSRLQWLLSHLEFVNLFREQDGAWTKRITFDGKVTPVKPEEIPERTHYIPFKWFDRSWFQFGANQDPYEVEPILSGNYRKKLVDILNAQGFFDKDAVDLFVQVLFLELAWNTILHSSRQAGDGFGILGAQIRHFDKLSPEEAQQPYARNIIFCIGDFGLGIPYTLREYYNQSGKTYEIDHECSIPSAIVRCAIEPNSTCRTIFPNISYLEGHRGLARVADSMRPSEKLAAGSLSIISCGGGLRLEGHDPVVRDKIIYDFEKIPVPGTFVTAILSIHRDKSRPTMLSGLPTEQPEIILVPSISWKEGISPWSEGKRNFTKGRPFVVLDLAYTDIDARNLESLTKEIAETSTSGSFVILWNVRSQWNQIEHVLTWWKNFDKPNKPTIAMVRGPNETALFLTGNLNAKHSSLYETLFILKEQLSDRKTDLTSNGIFRFSLKIDAYTEINTLVNSKYLIEGFKNGGPAEGFFSGKIHLLGGRDVDQFFSVARNSINPSRMRRWVSTCASGILRIITEMKVSNNDLIILGLSGAIKDILVQSWQELGIDIPIFTLMTYDIPTKEELAVNTGDRNKIIIVTDVLSSASLFHETTRVLKRLGKEVIGIVALVDARENKQEKLIPSAYHVFGSSFRVNKENQLSLTTEYWVDPVSFIPSSI